MSRWTHVKGCLELSVSPYEYKGKKVLLRCDLNVPIKNGIILDDNRIKESVKTIKYAI